MARKDKLKERTKKLANLERRKTKNYWYVFKQALNDEFRKKAIQ